MRRKDLAQDVDRCHHHAVGVDERRAGLRRAALTVIAVTALELSALGVRSLLDRAFILQPDPVLHHVWKPSTRFVDRARAVPYTLVVNGQSWIRDHDVARDKPAGVYRVFYLGDSNVQGVVEAELGMVHRVETSLNRAWSGTATRFEVVNTGTTSWSFVQYYLLLKTRLLEYRPDLVVFNIDMTDVSNDVFYRQFARRAPSGEIIGMRTARYRRYTLTPEGFVESRWSLPFVDWLAEHSAFADLVDRLVTRIGVPPRLKRQIVNRQGNWLAHDWDADTVAAVERALATVADAVAVARRGGVRVLVTAVPHHPQYTGEWSARPHRRLAVWAQAAGVPYFDAYEALRPLVAGTKVDRYYWSTDPTHFNADGNAIWADAHVTFLLGQGRALLPGEGPRARP